MRREPVEPCVPEGDPPAAPIAVPAPLIIALQLGRGSVPEPFEDADDQPTFGTRFNPGRLAVDLGGHSEREATIMPRKNGKSRIGHGLEGGPDHAFHRGGRYCGPSVRTDP